MRKLSLLFVAIFLFALLPFSASAAPVYQPTVTKNGLIYRMQQNEWFNWKKTNLTDYDTGSGVQRINNYIDKFVNSQITDIVFDVLGALSTAPSEVIEDYGDKYNRTEEQGVAVDYKQTTEPYAIWNQVFNVDNKDLYQIWIGKARSYNISPWLGMAMNLIPFNQEYLVAPTAQVPKTEKWDFTYTARANGLVRKESRGFTTQYDNCLDYEEETVRNLFKAYITEQVNRYDVDGIELDWVRENLCFRPGHEGAGRDVLTKFMGEIRAICDDAEEKWGHDIKIGVRVMRNPQQAFEMGFDVITWAEKGYVDRVAPSNYGYTNDIDMPIAMWNQMLENVNPNVELTPTLLNEVRSRPVTTGYTEKRASNGLYPTYAFALASAYFEHGADKIELVHLPTIYKPTTTQPDWWARKLTDDIRMLTHLGSPDTLKGLPKGYLVTYQDQPSLYSQSYQPFPLTSLWKPSALDCKFIRLQTDSISDTYTATLNLGYSYTNPEQAFYAGGLQVYVNNVRVPYVEEITSAAGVSAQLTANKIYSYQVPINALEGRTNHMIEVRNCISTTDIVFDFAEIRLVPPTPVTVAEDGSVSVGKTVTVYGTDYATCPATNLVDGSIENFADLGGVANAYWQIDLGGYIALDKITLFGRSSGEEASNLRISVARKADFSDEVIVADIEKLPPLTLTEYELTDKQTEFRYIRIKNMSDTNQYICLQEATVYAAQ